jgi:hypothetical protein
LPAEDNYHSAVVRALIKDGWSIIQEQVPLRVEKRRLWIDIQATKADGTPDIFVEVKAVEGVSAVKDLRDAVGQYILYRAALRYAKVEDYSLFLAIPAHSYEGIITEPLGEIVIREADIALVVFDVETEIIIKWLP